jgi:hypothetical protein
MHACCMGTPKRITTEPRGGSTHLLLELLVDRQIGGPLRDAPVVVPVGTPVLLRLLLAPEFGLPEPLEILQGRRIGRKESAERAEKV